VRGAKQRAERAYEAFEAGSESFNGVVKEMRSLGVKLELPEQAGTARG
jgi:hypothetical protein